MNKSKIIDQKSNLTLLTLLLIWLSVSFYPYIGDEHFTLLGLLDFFITTVSSMFSGASAEVKAAIIGSLILVLGVHLTNRAQAKTLRVQLNHDTQERLAERVGTARKEIYLEAAESSVQSLMSLMRVPDLEENSDPTAGLIEFQSACAKLKLIVDLETVEIIDDLNFALLKLLKAVIGFSRTLQDMRFKLKVLEEQHESIGNAIRAESMQMKAFVETESPSLIQIEQGAATIAALQSHQQDVLSQIEEDNTHYLSAYRSVRQRLMLDAEEINKAQVRMLDALRRDLGVDSDLNLFIDQAQRNLVRVQSLSAS